MTVESIFKMYFNGEPNLVTPNVYAYGFRTFGSKTLLFEKSWGDGIFSDNKIYAITFLLLEANKVQRIDLGKSFGSNEEINDYLISLSKSDIDNSDKYGEIKGV